MVYIEDLTGRLVFSTTLKLIDLFNFKLKKDVYIEFWEEEKFRSYFKNADKKLINPITGETHYPNGLYTYRKKEKEHGIAIILNSVWKKTLCHELMHCHQHEFLGRHLWKKIYKKYKGLRINNPLEITAELYAVNKIKKIDQ